MEKHRAVQSQIHSVIINQDEITDQSQTDIIEAYLENILLPKLTNDQTLSFEGIISEDEVLKNLKSLDTTKSPGMIDFLRNYMNASGMKSKSRF